LTSALLAKGLSRPAMLSAQRTELLSPLTLPTAGRTRGGARRLSLSLEHLFAI
jgi:hypothetical protein